MFYLEAVLREHFKYYVKVMSVNSLTNIAIKRNFIQRKNCAEFGSYLISFDSMCLLLFNLSNNREIKKWILLQYEL